MAAPSQSSTASVLNSWKEIASYLGRGVRTVQRYERDLALPVRRPRGTSRSAVIALREDLDSWLRKAPIGELQKLPRTQTPVATTMHVAHADAAQLRKQCHALRDAHHQAVTRLVTSLNGLVEEIHNSSRVKSMSGGLFESRTDK